MEISKTLNFKGKFARQKLYAALAHLEHTFMNNNAEIMHRRLNIVANGKQYVWSKPGEYVSQTGEGPKEERIYLEGIWDGMTPTSIQYMVEYKRGNFLIEYTFERNETTLHAKSTNEDGLDTFFSAL